jgi:hypothetical protein
VQYLAHSASFHSDDEIAPSKPGIKHLGSVMDALLRSGASTPATLHSRCRQGASTPSLTIDLIFYVEDRIDPLHGLQRDERDAMHRHAVTNISGDIGQLK